MKLKYYLRGLGIGIFITTIILSITLGGRTETLSDNEIIERAKELGMIEESQTDVKDQTIDYEEVQTEDDFSQEEQKNNTINSESDADTSDEEEVDTKDSKATESDLTQEKAQSSSEDVSEDSTKATTEVVESDEPIQVEITGGQSSESVANVLYESNVVDDASAFNQFLVENGYDARLRTGVFLFPANSTYEEIANILTLN